MSELRRKIAARRAWWRLVFFVDWIFPILGALITALAWLFVGGLPWDRALAMFFLCWGIMMAGYMLFCPTHPWYVWRREDR